MGLFVEPVGGSVPEDLLGGLARGFTEGEREQVQDACGCLSAEKYLRVPLAVWVLGPSASGKTWITRKVMRSYFGGESNGVIIDGGKYREYHDGWQRVVKDGLSRSPPGIHKEAWDIFKKTKCSEKMKAEMFQNAVQSRQNIVVPDCVGNLDKTRRNMQQAQVAGYEVLLIAIVCSEELTRSRGELRSVEEGKTFSTRGYVDSVRNSLSLLHEADANGMMVKTYRNTSLLLEIGKEEFESLSREYLCEGTETGFLHRYDSMATTCSDAEILSRIQSAYSMARTDSIISTTHASDLDDALYATVSSITLPSVHDT